jgi:hypothetical protein
LMHEPASRLPLMRRSLGRSPTNPKKIIVHSAVSMNGMEGEGKTACCTLATP